MRLYRLKVFESSNISVKTGLLLFIKSFNNKWNGLAKKENTCRESGGSGKGSVIVFPIITQEPPGRFALNFDMGTRENQGNVLCFVFRF